MGNSDPTVHTWGLQVVAEIDPSQREAIEGAIESLLCPNHASGTGECNLLAMASTTGTIGQVFAWMEMEGA